MAAVVACAGSATAATPAGQRTLMIRNLPKKFAAWDLVAEMKLYTRATAFDYVYVPWDRKGSNNVGYGFVNFLEAATAAEVCRSMQGQALRMGDRPRPIKVQPAHVQGLAENLQRFVEQDESMDDVHAPLVFAEGQLLDLDSVLRQLGDSCGCASSAATTCGDEGLSSPRCWMSVGSSGDEAAGDEAMPSPSPQPLAVFRPPPGLEDVVPLGVAALPGYAASRREVSALLRQLLAAR